MPPIRMDIILYAQTGCTINLCTKINDGINFELNTQNFLPPIVTAKTDTKDDTKRIFIKPCYIKEMNGHIPKEIIGFLKKLDFKVTFILINETFNLKRLFTFKERQNKLHRSSVVYRITCSCKSTYIGQTSRNLITRLKNHDPSSQIDKTPMYPKI